MIPLVSAVPVGIPYVPFPTIEIGPLTIQVFGLCVAAGVLLGGYVTARRNARLGISTDDTERIVIALVLAGVVGARILWVLTNLDRIEGPIDLIAVWDGGLQFSGGFILALLVAPYLVRNLSKEQRWHMIDGAAIGLAIGLMFGRIGCYAVGEHLGGTTTFPLGITYQGTPGDTIEGPLVVGETYWALPVVEFLYVGVILAVMLLVDRKGRFGAGTLAGVFCIGYAVSRFASDFLRTFDDTVYGFTGAQYMCIVLLPVGLWFLLSARRRESPAVYRDRLAAEQAVAERDPAAAQDEAAVVDTTAAQDEALAQGGTGARGSTVTDDGSTVDPATADRATVDGATTDGTGSPRTVRED